MVCKVDSLLSAKHAHERGPCARANDSVRFVRARRIARDWLVLDVAVIPRASTRRDPPELMAETSVGRNPPACAKTCRRAARARHRPVCAMRCVAPALCPTNTSHANGGTSSRVPGRLENPRVMPSSDRPGVRRVSGRETAVIPPIRARGSRNSSLACLPISRDRFAGPRTLVRPGSRVTRTIVRAWPAAALFQRGFG